MEHLLRVAAAHAADYRASLTDRPVRARLSGAELKAGFARPLGAAGRPASDVLADLVEAADGGLVASAGPRYFGFVNGGSLPSATAAEIVATGWDQNGWNGVLSPTAAAAEETAGTWLKDVLGIPATASTGFVTGAQAGNTVGLAAARNHVLAQAGWDVERLGLAGAPRVRILASEERHGTIDRSLRLLGFGTEAITPVRTDAQGALDIEDLSQKLDPGNKGPLIVCLQAGNVNTGAVDPLEAAIALVRAYGGWTHIDGAFGLWAAASPRTKHLVKGLEGADSWSCDGHKWLNLPYDSGFAFCAHPTSHAAAMSYRAPYLVGAGDVYELGDFTPESSRRARGLAVWAGLQELGRDGVTELVDRCCELARRFADQLAAAGFEIGNDVVLNQVLVSYGDDATTDRVIEAVQRGGVCWMGGTTWHGRRYMRISVSNYLTTAADVDLSVEAITAAASA
ncbi:pyridoxal-dependent decarboxylase [Kribbella sp. NBC_01245]|uniref:pyridoxal phosphate-dependent decarboxylase family protein n=1 Tax=Kribbella sp. NBC_01245 TaxID=2903578 RepID=UPI002E2E511B|nr:aminotransferase class V-fold PLP-dependent enzyme [Kribbella sp. NBC_01245]